MSFVADTWEHVLFTWEHVLFLAVRLALSEINNKWHNNKSIMIYKLFSTT